MTDDRGVSEVIGFVLVFSLITMTIAIVFTAGLGGLQDAQQAEQVNNVERAFDVMGDNLAKVQSQQAPSRTTEVKLLDGSIGLQDETTITVRVIDKETGETKTDEETGEKIERTVTSRPIVYSDGGSRSIVYEGGAIFRTDGESSVMLREPRHIRDEERIVLPVVVTDGSQTSLSGGGTVLIAGEGQSWNVDDYSDATGTVQIEIESPRSDAWARYFDEIDGLTEAEIGENRIVYEVEDQHDLVIHRTKIGITLSR